MYYQLYRLFFYQMLMPNFFPLPIFIFGLITWFFRYKNYNALSKFNELGGLSLNLGHLEKNAIFIFIFINDTSSFSIYLRTSSNISLCFCTFFFINNNYFFVCFILYRKKKINERWSIWTDSKLFLSLGIDHI